MRWNVLFTTVTWYSSVLFCNGELTENCDYGPQLSINETVLWIHKNSNVTVTCFSGPASSGDQHTYLKWTRKSNGVTVPIGNATTETLRDVHEKQRTIWDAERLVIGKFTQFDVGDYYCERKYCNRSMKVEMNLIEPQAPNISLNVQPTLKVLEGRSKNLVCDAFGSPVPRLLWYQDKHVVGECEEPPCSIAVNRGLKVPSHHLSFTCVANNEIGTHTKTVAITILVGPEMKRNNQGIHKSGTFSCSVLRAYPSAKIVWRYQSSSCSVANLSCIPESTGWKEISKSVLSTDFQIETINNANENTSILTTHNSEQLNGFLECVAVNEAGSDGDYFRVLIQKESTKSNMTTWVVVGIVFACLLFVVFVVVIGYYIIKYYIENRYSKFFSPYNDYQVKNDTDLMEQGLHLPYNTAWEYPRNQLEFIKILGSGAFGQVWLARAIDVYNWNADFSTEKQRKRKNSLQEYIRKTSRSNNNKTNYHSFVAVKTLKDDASESEYRDLASEIKVLIHIGKHKNIVNLLGACTRGGSLFAILEYCPYGDLKNFLKSSRANFVDEWSLSHATLGNRFTVADMVLVAYHIAEGLAFLHRKKLVHRDLACRNILLGESYCIKISDFGLARDISKNDCYIKATTGMLPVKWMSPEALFDRVYNVKSDIWSFGIVLWEIVTLGGSPYPGIPPEDLFTYINNGYRMSKPEACPTEIYDVMTQCWLSTPQERPDCEHVANILEKILKTEFPEDPLVHTLLEQRFSHSDEAFHKTGAFNEHATRRQSRNSRYLLDTMIKFISKKRPVSTTEDHLLSRLSSSGCSDVTDHKGP